MSLNGNPYKPILFYSFRYFKKDAPCHYSLQKCKLKPQWDTVIRIFNSNKLNCDKNWLDLSEAAVSGGVKWDLIPCSGIEHGLPGWKAGILATRPARARG